jgi:diacylglycerol kinase (ATP)
VDSRWTILVNQKAGALRVTADPQDVRCLAEEAGIDAEVVETASAEELRETVRRLLTRGVRQIAVSGGDGTVACAVQEMAYTPGVLGILPQGTANNFATALGLPREADAALRILRDGVVREVDLGKIGDRYFTEGAGVGLFADALAWFGSTGSKNPFRALFVLVRIILSLRARRIRLVFDGQPVAEHVVMCTVANSYRLGPGAPVAPQARVTDGKLDVVVIGDLGRLELFRYYQALRRKQHLSLPKVTSARASEIRIEARRPMRVHCDDQIVGVTPATITSHPRALKVVVEKL